MRVDGIANFRAKSGTDITPCLTSIMPHEVWNVLNKQVSWAMVLKYSDNVVKEIPPLRAVKSLLFASFGERLAGKASAEDIMRRNILIRYPYITCWAQTMIFLVEVGKNRV
jgi:hypothetical protein